MKMKPCRICGRTDMKVSDCGYSSFNVGRITCKCGYEIGGSCSSDPVQAKDDLIRRWNSSEGGIDEMRSALAALVRLYVANRHVPTSTFVSCITPSHAIEMTPAERKQCKVWSAWDAARRALGEFVELPARAPKRTKKKHYGILR